MNISNKDVVEEIKTEIKRHKGINDMNQMITTGVKDIDEVGLAVNLSLKFKEEQVLKILEKKCVSTPCDTYNSIRNAAFREAIKAIKEGKV